MTQGLLTRFLNRVAGAGSATPWDKQHPFDRDNGVDTSGHVPPEKLLVDAADAETALAAQARAYGGSQPSILRAALRSLPPLDACAFVDLGCGKGRPLIVASEFPFRDIVGVEFSAPLVEIARRNAAIIAGREPQRPAIRLHQGDAGAFAMPVGDAVVFLYNPFGADIMARVVSRIEEALRSARRAIYVVYYNPVHGALFDACPLLERRFAGQIPYAQEELGFGPDADDPVVIWQGGAAPPPAQKPADLRIVPAHEYRANLLAA